MMKKILKKIQSETLSSGFESWRTFWKIRKSQWNLEEFSKLNDLLRNFDEKINAINFFSLYRSLLWWWQMMKGFEWMFCKARKSQWNLKEFSKLLIIYCEILMKKINKINFNFFFVQVSAVMITDDGRSWRRDTHNSNVSSRCLKALNTTAEVISIDHLELLMKDI